MSQQLNTEDHQKASNDASKHAELEKQTAEGLQKESNDTLLQMQTGRPADVTASKGSAGNRFTGGSGMELRVTLTDMDLPDCANTRCRMQSTLLMYKQCS